MTTTPTSGNRGGRRARTANSVMDLHRHYMTEHDADYGEALDLMQAHLTMELVMAMRNVANNLNGVGSRLSAVRGQLSGFRRALEGEEDVLGDTEGGELDA